MSSTKFCSSFLLVVILLLCQGTFGLASTAGSRHIRGISAQKGGFYFIRNSGQFDSSIQFYAVSGRTLIYFAKEAIYLSLAHVQDTGEPRAPLRGRLPLAPDLQASKVVGREIVKLMPVGASAKLCIKPVEQTQARFNYFLGNDRRKWRSNVPSYRAIVYENVYPRIDLKFYSNASGELEYDIIVEPGGDPSRVKFAYEGIQGLELQRSGDLAINLWEHQIVQRKPLIHQNINGKRRRLDGSFRILSKLPEKRFAYTFEVAEHNKKTALYIDPVISFSTFLGGSVEDFGYDIAGDTADAIYVTGGTYSLDFPTTPGAFQTTGDGSDVFVTKFSSDGSSIIYSTYLGGTGPDGFSSITVDSSGSAYVACTTSSPDFPTVNPYQAALAGGNDAAIARLNADGSALLYGTYLGGTAGDYAAGIGLDASGNIYVAGATLSIDFPVQNALQATAPGNTNGFVTELNNSGNALIYSTYFGGSVYTNLQDMAVGSIGEVYIAGESGSADFPTTPGAFQTSCAETSGCSDAYVTRIAPGGGSLAFSTLLGGTGPDVAFALAVDDSQAVYVTGETLSEDFPLVNPAQSSPGGGNVEAFVSKVSPDGSSLVYSTYLGGNDWDVGDAIAVDAEGSAYISGVEFSTDFPTVDPLPVECGLDAFITRVTPDGGAWYYSTCLGGDYYDEAWGIAVDSTGAAYVTGQTLSLDFPVRNAVQPANAGDYDAFVTKLICDSISRPVVFETDGTATFTVRLCLNRSSDVIISYATSDGTAVAGVDYVATSGQLIIPSGSKIGIIEVPLIDRPDTQPDRTFFLNITSSDVDFGLSQVTATILERGLLFDDFEDGIVSWNVQKGAWTENGGDLIGTGANTAVIFAPQPWPPSGVTGCGTCAIETDVVTTGGATSRVLFEGWYQDKANRVELVMNEGADKWILKQRVGGKIVAKAKAQALIDPNIRYDISLSFDGTNFNLVVNGASLMSLPAAAAPFGNVGFKVKRTTASFGHIRVL